MTYEVQHHTIQYGWINSWLYDEGDGLRPETFETREAAQAALDEHIEDLWEELLAGNIRCHDSSEFRIREVSADAYNNVRYGE